MDSLPSPPASLSSGKNPWMVNKHQPSTSPSPTTASKLERLISFLLAAWTTLSSVQPTHRQQQPSIPSPTPPTSSSSSTISNSKALATRSLLPSMARQCLDLIMFTSAMVITLFSYFSGELDNKKPISSSSYHAHASKRLVTSSASPSIAIIPPPSQHTIMDIKELRKWQQQQQQQQQQTPSLLGSLEYITGSCPMDDQKHQRIMAWAFSQGHQDQQQQQQSMSSTKGQQLTSLSLQRQDRQQLYSQHVDDDDDEKYTFDERWSVDGGEPILMNSHHQHHLHLTPHSKQASFDNKKSSSAATSTTSSSNNPSVPQEEDRRLAFMEVQVASLIQQGQAALNKKIKVHELDPKEIAMRRALKQGQYEKS